MKKIKSLSNLTYYMTTFHGCKRLLITLAFLKRSKFDGQVVVVDATTESQSALYKDFDFLKYIHKPGCTPAEGAAIAGSMVRTRYAALIGDDDLPILSGVRKAVKFLDQNSNFDAVYGNAGLICFDRLSDFNNLNLFDRFKFAVKTLLSENYTRYVKLDYLSVCERLTAIKNRYIVGQFFITRTNSIHRIYNKNYHSISDVHVSEYGFSFAHAAICVTKKLNCTYLLRGTGSHRPNSDREAKRHQIQNRNKMEREIKDFVKACDFKSEYREVVEQLIKEARHKCQEIQFDTRRPRRSSFLGIREKIGRLKFILIGQSFERIRLAFCGCNL